MLDGPITNAAAWGIGDGYEGWPEPERKRHLVRLWVRREGRRSHG